jgi:putative Holliday junction resolvase
MTQFFEKKYSKLGHKNMLSVDYGTKVVGLATFNQGRDPYPLPFGRIIYKDDETLITEIRNILLSEDLNIIILGVPYLTDGQSTKMTTKILNFAKKCEDQIPEIPLFTQDETLSTFEAKERMKQMPQYNFKVDMKKIDELAAAIILEAFVEKINLDQSN